MRIEPEIWAVILAAGESKRMNGPKLILPYGKTSIIGHLVENIRKSDIENIMVVLGGWKEELAKAIKGLSVKCCFNVNYKSGMLSSVICGLNSLPSTTGAAIIFPGDQPEISPDLINELRRVLNHNTKGIIVAVHNGKRGHPILIRRNFFPQVERLNAGIGLRELLSKFPDEVFEVEAGNDHILMDIDTQDDYLRAIGKSK